MSAKAAAVMRRRLVGYVLQTFDLWPFLTAKANVGMPLVLDGVPAREVDARVDFSARFARRRRLRMLGTSPYEEEQWGHRAESSFGTSRQRGSRRCSHTVGTEAEQLLVELAPISR